MTAVVYDIRRRGLTPIGQRRLGELIEWTPLGPGGFPPGSLQGLGSVLPVLPEKVDAALAQLLATDEQITLEMGRVMQGGGDVSDLQNQRALALETLAALTIEAHTIRADGIPGWLVKAQTSQIALDSLLSEFIKRRRKTEFGLRAGGVLWGAGAAIAASVALYWLWQNRRKLKRRRQK
jgi:hypothetical protein